MSKLDLDELEQLAKAATPGPWRVIRNGLYQSCGVKGPDGAPLAMSGGRAFLGGFGTNDAPIDHPNAAYIAAANPATVLALIGRLRRLEQHAPGCHEVCCGPVECGCWERGG